MHIPQTDNSPDLSSRRVIRRAVVPVVLVMFFLVCAGSPPSLRADPIPLCCGSFFDIFTELDPGGGVDWTTTPTYSYDFLTGLFADFLVFWNGVVFDLTSQLNIGTFADRQGWQLALLDPAANNWAAQVVPGEMRFFFSADAAHGISLAVSPPSPSPPLNFSQGTFTVSPAGVPEPATLTLCGIGLGGLFLTRYARGRRRGI